MRLNDEQYDRVGRYLDGQSVELSAAELAVAEDIRQAEQAVGGMLDVPVPPGAMDRARRRVWAELARRRRLVVRFAWPAAAVAAAILLAVAVSVLTPTRPVEQPPAVAEISAELIGELYAGGAQNIDLDLIAVELDELEADIMVSAPCKVFDVEIDSLQQSVDRFWLEEQDLWSDEM